MRLTLSALVILLAAGADAQFSREWQSPNLGTTAWGSSYGYDVDGDGIPNLSVRAGGTLTVYNPDYSVYWVVNFPGYDYAYLVSPRDVDGDGLVRPVNMDADPAGEVVVTGYRLSGSDYYGVIRVYDAATRALEWESAELAGFYGTASVDDVDGDGRHEIIVTRTNYSGGWGYVEVYGCAGAGAVGAERYLLKSGFRVEPSVADPVVNVAFQLGSPGQVRLRVLDSAGREVKVLVDGSLPAGEHRVSWNGADGAGCPVPAGTYFYRLECGDAAETGRVVLVR